MFFACASPSEFPTAVNCVIIFYHTFPLSISLLKALHSCLLLETLAKSVRTESDWLLMFLWHWEFISLINQPDIALSNLVSVISTWNVEATGSKALVPLFLLLGWNKTKNQNQTGGHQLKQRRKAFKGRFHAPGLRWHLYPPSVCPALPCLDT